MINKRILIGMLFVFIVASIADGAMNWVERTSPVTVRFSAAAVYDENSERILLFGGNDGDYKNDLWSFNGIEWEEIECGADKPNGREQHAMAYDAERSKVVLFGGVDIYKPGSYGDTWEWNGSEWIQRYPTNSPPPRHRHAMAYDSIRQKTVLFGGLFGDEPYNDTWEWDGINWTMIETSIDPGGVCGHSMVFDSVSGKVILFGGTVNDVWEWDGVAWTMAETTCDKPEKRWRAGMIYDEERHKIVVFGGLTPNYVDETWEWDGQNWQRVETENKPSARISHAMVYYSTKGETILFGGYDGEMKNDTWSYDGSDWERVPTIPASPSYRFEHDMTYDSINERVILFGGKSFNNYLNDTWSWDGTEWVLLEPSVKPPGMYGCEITFDPLRETVLLYGGRYSSGRHDDTWEYDGDAWRQVETPDAKPDALLGHATAYDSDRNRVVLYGGINGYGPYYEVYISDELWEWDGTEWRKIEIAEGAPRPYPLAGHAMAYDSCRKCTVLFGGYTGAPYFPPTYINETWEWDGEQWRYREPAENVPMYREYHNMSFDQNRCRTVLYGGFHQMEPPLDDTWEWDGYDWHHINTEMTPRKTSSHAMAYDSARKRTVMFGGGGEYYGQETYEYYNTDPDVCEQLGVTIEIPDDYFRAGDEFYCRAAICNNTGMRLEGMPLFIMLDAFGSLFWGPDFGEDVDCYIDEYPVIEEGETTVEAVEPFEWPDNAGEAQGICFYAAMTDPDVSFLYGFMDSAAFGWGE